MVNTLDGEYVDVGASFEDIDGDEHVGAAYVFHNNGTTWVEQARLTASDGEEWDHFGGTVDITSDGDYIVVGAHQKVSASGTGEAYVYSRSGTTWTEQATLNGTGVVARALFGCSVAIDGNTVVVGAKYDGSTDDTDEKWKRGEVYVFTRSGSTWSEQANLLASDWDDRDIFGASVDIVGDYAVIGAREGSCGEEDDAGAAYIFTRSGATWTQQDKVCDPDAGSQDWFGFSVAIDGDGNTIVVGARQDDDNGTDAGSAFVFTRSGTIWSFEDQLIASDSIGEDWFGRTVSISADGDSALVGANQTDIIMVGLNVGTAYYFTRSGSSWTEEFTINADDKASGDEYGWDVYISGDGEYGVIGAPKDNVGLFGDAGSAYIVGLTSTACQ
jgi:hypothetical protein